jgi:formimidoylglutamate deiminase
MHDSDVTAFAPDLLYLSGRFERRRALVCDGGGRILSAPRLEHHGGSDEDLRRDVENATGSRAAQIRVVRLRNRAMLPGMVNAHSHAFQRVIRGRTEYRSARAQDSFWTWREMMYGAAARLTPEDIYDAARMAFLEMALGGIASVGEFHYLHRAPGGHEYDDPNLLARQVVRAARDVGLRIALLRVAYARAGFRASPDERQLRFTEPDAETFIRNTDSLARDLASEEGARIAEAARVEGKAVDSTPRAWVGVAPHSVRAVPAEYIRRVNLFAVERGMPVHMHVAEQPAEVESCVAETGRTPLALLADEGILGPHFTGVHTIHVTAEEVAMSRKAGARVCACPTTERNLGDGVFPADLFFDAGVPVALGTDSHAQIDLLEDARELEYNLRLRRLRRNVLAPAALEQGRAVTDDEGAREVGGAREKGGGASAETDASRMSTLAARLFECATRAGAQSIGANAGEFAPGGAADFFTVDTEDPSVAGASPEDLLPAIVFSLARAAVREVAVGGRLVVEGGRHEAQGEIVSRFAALQTRLWG